MQPKRPEVVRIYVPLIRLLSTGLLAAGLCVPGGLAAAQSDSDAVTQAAAAGQARRARAESGLQGGAQPGGTAAQVGVRAALMEFFTTASVVDQALQAAQLRAEEMKRSG